MIFVEAPIQGAYVIDLDRRTDERGYFARAWCADEFAKHGLVSDLSQINVARSTHVGTLRGMHFQLSPHAEAKLVRCTQGSVFDVLADLRPRSPSLHKDH